MSLDWATQIGKVKGDGSVDGAVYRAVSAPTPIEPKPDAPPFTVHVYGAVPPETLKCWLPLNAIWVAAEGVMLSVSIVTLAHV
jgi:hypothetical protein